MADILVVDDNPQARAALRDQLLTAHHRVVEAEDGVGALRALGRAAPDVLVCDLFMPNIDGIEIIRTVREIAPGVKIIAVSGGGQFGLEPHLDIAKKLGADVTFAKPVRYAQLVGAIADLLAGKAGAN